MKGFEKLKDFKKFVKDYIVILVGLGFSKRRITWDRRKIGLLVNPTYRIQGPNVLRIHQIFKVHQKLQGNRAEKSDPKPNSYFFIRFPNNPSCFLEMRKCARSAFSSLLFSILALSQKAFSHAKLFPRKIYLYKSSNFKSVKKFYNVKVLFVSIQVCKFRKVLLI